jgi:hypothetical protein
LGFKLGDIQKARQTKAIAEMTRSLELPAEVRERVQNPRAKLLSTLERVFDSSMGKSFLMVEADPDHGLKGTTTKKEFLRGFTKLVTDIAMGKQSSRTLNKGENIEEYFDTWMPEDRPAKKRGSFVPADIIEGRSVEPLAMKPKPAPKRSRDVSATVIPKSLKVRYGHERLVDIRDELCKLKRAETPNAGAVLLRVFLELSILDYLRRSGELQGLVADLERKQSRVPHGVPTLRQLLPAITAMAKRRLSQDEARTVEKALRPDKAAPFTLGDLHAFVHSVVDLPGENDIRQFWLRTEPLFRLMLEQELEGEE